MSEEKQATEEQDISVVAKRLATQALREEEATRQAVRAKVAGAAKAKKDDETGKVRLPDGRLVEPLAAFMQSATEDFTLIPDEFVKRNKHGKYHVRWVGRRDIHGEESDTEIQYYKRFGFEPILGADGDPKKPFMRKEFLAMQGPPEGFAALLARTSRPGSDVYESAFKDLDDLAAETNKRAGKRVVDIVTAEDHGPEPAHRVTL